ncbi:sulfite exporter TauE/SafE family protein [candidate division KSB1 bacterium]|nr:sulfite exporter TauE/SafE family protein [candidate division KSB1 bacterium]
MNPEQWLPVGLTLFFSGLLQSTAGFGFGLLALPLLLMQGFSLVQAATFTIIGSGMHRVMAVTHLRRAVNWKELLPMIGVGLCALPLGLFLMASLSSMAQSQVRQIIGGTILVVLLVQWFSKIEPREKVHRAWGFVAAFFAGILNGMANIGGPPIVLWILAHKWHNEKFRVTALAFSITFVPFQIASMTGIFGSSVLLNAARCLVFFPIILLGGWLGLKVGWSIDIKYLRLLARLLLLIIALVSIFRN